MLHLKFERVFVNFCSLDNITFNEDSFDFDMGEKENVLYYFMFGDFTPALENFVGFLHSSISKLEYASETYNFDLDVSVVVKIARTDSVLHKSVEYNISSLEIEVIPSLEENWFAYIPSEGELFPLFKKLLNGAYIEADPKISVALTELLLCGWEMYEVEGTLSEPAISLGGIRYIKKF